MSERWTAIVFFPSSTKTKIRAVKYYCGCVIEEAEPKPYVLFPNRCPEHNRQAQGVLKA